MSEPRTEPQRGGGEVSAGWPHRGGGDAAFSHPWENAGCEKFALGSDGRPPYVDTAANLFDTPPPRWATPAQHQALHPAWVRRSFAMTGSAGAYRS